MLKSYVTLNFIHAREDLKVGKMPNTKFCCDYYFFPDLADF